MQVEWTNKRGEKILLYVSGRENNCNWEDCYVVSLQPNSKKVFLVPVAETSEIK